MLKHLHNKLTVAFSFLCSVILGIIFGLTFYNDYKNLQMNNYVTYGNTTYELFSYISFVMDSNYNQTNLAASGSIDYPYYILQQSGEQNPINKNPNQRLTNIWETETDLQGKFNDFYSTYKISTFSDEEIRTLYLSDEIYQYVYPDEYFATFPNAYFIENSIYYNSAFSFMIEDPNENGQAASTEDGLMTFTSSSNFYPYNIIQFPEARITIDNKEYNASLFMLFYQDPSSPDAPLQMHRLFLLEDMSFFYQKVFNLAIKYLLIFLVCFIIISLLCSFAAKQMLHSTKKSLQQQADFVAAASHEFKNPLTIIKSSLTMLENNAGRDKDKKYLKIAQNEAQQLQNLTHDLLILAGSNAGKWNVSTCAIDLDTVLIETHEKFLAIAKDKNVALKLVLPEDVLPNINGDDLRIKQILDILVNNALQYSPKGKSIEITASRKKSKIEISVIDHGSGVQAEDKPKIFDKFYRADKSRTDKEHFGLGLSVAKELAMLHDGSIELFDTEGGGATFVLELPVKNK